MGFRLVAHRLKSPHLHTKYSRLNHEITNDLCMVVYGCVRAGFDMKPVIPPAGPPTHPTYPPLPKFPALGQLATAFGDGERNSVNFMFKLPNKLRSITVCCDPHATILIAEGIAIQTALGAVSQPLDSSA